MQLTLPTSSTTGAARPPISPYREMGAYEALWKRPETTFHRLAVKFQRNPGALPSDFVEKEEAQAAAAEVVERFEAAGIDRFGVRIHGDAEYRPGLRDAKNPLELLYYQGIWNWTESPSVSVVGTRNPTLEGERRAARLTRQLVADGWTIVSGLARGIDTVAHTTALAEGGRTIAVLGTPLSESYPRENAELQREIASRFLVISQIPLLRYLAQDYRANRAFFPQRNVTMAALSRATVIVEAGESSGTLTQARAALSQGRQLLILDSCFRRSDLTWPQRFLDRGAVRVKDHDEIRQQLGPAPLH